jgi:hypothetical protein
MLSNLKEWLRAIFLHELNLRVRFSVNRNRLYNLCVRNHRAALGLHYPHEAMPPLRARLAARSRECSILELWTRASVQGVGILLWRLNGV